MSERIEAVVKRGRRILYTNEDGKQVSGVPEDGVLKILKEEFGELFELGAVQNAKGKPKATPILNLPGSAAARTVTTTDAETK